MKYFLLLFLLVGRVALGQTPDSAQVTAIPPVPTFKYSYITELGSMLAFTRTPHMQEFFQQNQIKRAFPLDPFVYFTAGGRYQRVKAILEFGYATNGWTQWEQNDAAARRTYGAYSGILLGYDVLNSRNSRLYLNVGIGGLFYEYSVYGHSSQPVAFSNILQYSQPGTISSLKLSNTYWDLNVEFTQREKRKVSPAFVFRAGYRQGWRAETWESGAFPLTGAPVDRIGQFYVTTGYSLSKNYAKTAKR